MKTYANVGWTPNDVMDLFDITEEEARDFLIANAGDIQDRLVQLGWEIMEDLGRMDGLKRNEENL